MARRKRVGTVKTFGGVETIGNIKAEAHFDGREKDVNYDVQSLEVKSESNLEQDEGFGSAVVVREFKFAVNPEAFKQHTPSKQELFNHHHKGIEVALWKDGLKVFPDVNPRVSIDQNGKTYRIVVGALPMKGHILHQRPKTLKELVHGNRSE